MKQEISSTITVLRFPVCMLVVMIHSQTGGLNFEGSMSEFDTGGGGIL